MKGGESMADLNLKKQEMRSAIKSLRNQVKIFNDTTRRMGKDVTTLCDNWKAQASSVYREDYTKLTDNFTHTIDVVNSLITSTEKYMADMDKLDAAYSKSKVSN